MGFPLRTSDVVNVLGQMGEPTAEGLAENLLGQLDQARIAQVMEAYEGQPVEQMEQVYAEIRAQLENSADLPSRQVSTQA